MQLCAKYDLAYPDLEREDRIVRTTPSGVRIVSTRIRKFIFCAASSPLRMRENVGPHKNGVCTLWPNLNRLYRLVPCGKGNFYSKAKNSLDFKFVLVPSVAPDSVAPTLHIKNGKSEPVAYKASSS